MTVKWPTPDEKRLREFYLERLLDENMDRTLDEIDELAASSYEVSLCFGSTGYEFRPRYLLGGQTTSIFLHGYCALFAHCFNEISGQGRYLLISKRAPEFGKWEGHLLATLGEDEFFDIEGIHTLAELQRAYSTSEFEYALVDEAHLWTCGVLNREQYEHPAEFVDELEREFVALVVAQAMKREGLVLS